MRTLSQSPLLNCAFMNFLKLRFVRHQTIDRAANVLHCSVSTDHDCSNVIVLDARFSELGSRQSQKGIGICERMIDPTDAIGQIAISLIWDLALKHV